MSKSDPYSIDAINHYGADSQIIKAIEELAELQQALAKFLNHRHYNQSTDNLVDNVVDEMIDVYTMLDQMTLLFSNTEKIRRAKKRVKKQLLTELELLKITKKNGTKKGNGK